MRDPNLPTTLQADDPIELELLAMQEMTAHPELLQMQLLFMGGMLVASAVEAAAEEELALA